MRHDPAPRDCIPCVVCRQCVGAARALSERRRRHQRGRPGDHGLDVQAKRVGTISRDHPGPLLRRRQLQAAGFTRPELVESIYYPNAYHSFDSRSLDRTVPGTGSKMHHLAYDPDAASDAEARTKAFFDKYLNQP
jgi:hypothetical protein